MNQRAKPAPRLAPLPPNPELNEVFAVFEKAPSAARAIGSTKRCATAAAPAYVPACLSY